jgi:hypothetical protein
MAENQGAFWGAAAGAALGLLFGNPLAGLYYGASIGSLFDTETKESPTYDFTVNRNTRSEQLPIQVIYGEFLTTGNIIYETQPGPHTYKDYVYKGHTGINLRNSSHGITQNQLSRQNIIPGRLYITVLDAPEHEYFWRVSPDDYTVNWEAGIIYFDYEIGAGSKEIWFDYWYLPSTVSEMKVQIGLSQGPIEGVSNITVNDIPIESILNSSYSIYLGTANQTADARNPNNETFHYLAYLACTFTANQQLSGSTKISCLVAGLKINVWNGSAWVNQWSNNPAYCLLDWLTNERYGCGESIEKFDLETFKTAAAYCDALVNGEPRYQLNINIDTKMKARDSIEMISQTFAGFMYENEAGLICLGVEKSESPVHSFSLENIVEGSFSYTPFPSKINVPNRLYIEFKDYSDPSGKWPMSKILIEDEIDMEIRRENNIHPVVVEKTIQLRGVIHPSQAGRLGRLIFDYARICPVVCSLRGGIDSSLVKVGQVVTVSHDVPGWTNKLFRVIALEHHDDYETTFTLRDYNGNIYHDRPVVYIPGSGTSLSDPFIVMDVINLEVTEQSYTNNSGVVITGLKATFTLPVISNFSHCTVEYSSNGGTTWVNSAPATTNEAFISGLEVGTYYSVRVKVANTAGITSNGVTSDSVQIIGHDLPPAAPQDLVFSWDTPDLKVFWGAVVTNNDGSNTIDIKDYKVEVYNGATLKYTETSVQSNLFTYTYNQNISDNAPNGATSLTIKVYTRDFAGTLSTAAQIACTCSAPTAPTITAAAEIARIQIVAGLTNLQLQNYAKLQIKASQTDGFNPDAAGALIHDNPATVYGHPVDTGSTWYYRARIVNKFNIASGWSAQATATADKIDESDFYVQTLRRLTSSYLNADGTGAYNPTAGTLANLSDGSFVTGATFTGAGYVQVNFKLEQVFETIRLVPLANVNFFGQYFNEDSQQWVDCCGSAASPKTATPLNGTIPYVAQIDPNVPAKKMRIKLLGAATIYELRFSTYGEFDSLRFHKATGDMIEAGAITVGNQLQAPIPMAINPANTRVWHFDNSLSSTAGDQPLAGYVATLLNHGVFGGSVALEEGTTNLILPDDLSDLHTYIPGNPSVFAVQQSDGYWRLLLTPSPNEILMSAKVYNVQPNTAYTESFMFKHDGTITFAFTFFTNEGHHSVPATIETLNNGIKIAKATYTTTATTTYIRAIDINYISGTATYIDINYCQLEAKSFRTSYVNGTRAVSKLPYNPSVFNQNEFTVFMKWLPYQNVGTFPGGASNRFFHAYEGAGGVGKRIAGFFPNTTNYIGMIVPNADGTADNYISFDTISVTANQQQSLAFVKTKDNKLRIHYNNDYKEVSITAPFLLALSEFYVGCANTTAGQLNGRIDELLISSVAATPAQISAWANSESPFYLSNPAIDANSQNIVAGNMEFTGLGQKNYAFGDDLVRRVCYEQDILGNTKFFDRNTGNLVWTITNRGELKDKDDYPVLDVNGVNGKIKYLGTYSNSNITDILNIGDITIPTGKKWIAILIPIESVMWTVSNASKTLKSISNWFLELWSSFDFEVTPGVHYGISGILPSGTYDNLRFVINHYTTNSYGYTDGTFSDSNQQSVAVYYQIVEVNA